VKTTPTQFKSGYAAILGRPNVGKSTLLNRLVMQKIAAMSRKPQTTRNKILGVVHLPGGQIILIDTPGIHDSSIRLNRMMVEASLSTLKDVDLVLFMIDAERGFLPEDQDIAEALSRAEVPRLLIINKIDRVAKPKLLGLIAEGDGKGVFSDIVPISALKSDGLDRLQELVLSRLPEGPMYFPEGMVTDCPEEFLISEIVREKIMNLTHMEVPYSVAVVVDRVEESEKGTWVISVTVYTEKASQKRIIIGEKGAMLKKVGTQARKEIEKRFGTRVYLSLFVKVKTHWREDERSLKQFGYYHDSYQDR
jgi:GTP-binding protein Era